MKRVSIDEMYLKMATVISERSYCNRKQVGCVIVKDNMIVSDGYNGTPTGFENVCEDENGDTHKYVLHAEANALTKLAKSTNSSKDATLYVTMSPCYECSKLIIQTGIKRVVFSELYRIDDGLKLLEKAGIEIIHFKKEML
ncbi:dCMP deaminase family protein [bacterium]|nr:dCMP deaminase family protein [bacterium]